MGNLLLSDSPLYNVQQKTEFLSRFIIKEGDYLEETDFPDREWIIETDWLHLVGITHSLVKSGNLSEAKKRYRLKQHVQNWENNKGIVFEKARECLTPPKDLKACQLFIHLSLRDCQTPDYLFNTKGPIENAEAHLHSPSVYSLDITGFYQHTEFRFIHRFFKDLLCCSKEMAHWLTEACTLNRQLPIGAPSSPVLSFWAYKDMWDAIERVSRKNGCLCTIFFDDITISDDRVPGSLIWKIKAILHHYGFTVNKIKERRYYPERYREINGVVFKHGDRQSFQLPSRKHLKQYLLRRDIYIKQQTIIDEQDLIELKKLKQSLGGVRNWEQQLTSG